MLYGSYHLTHNTDLSVVYRLRYLVSQRITVKRCWCSIYYDCEDVKSL